MKTSLSLVAALTLTASGFVTPTTDLQGDLFLGSGVYASFRQAKQSAPNPSNWNIDGTYASVFKFKGDAACPDEVKIANSKSLSPHLSSVEFKDILEDGKACQTADKPGSLVSYTMDYVKTVVGMEESEEKHKFSSRLSTNPNAQAQLEGTKKLQHSRVSFDHYEASGPNIFNARLCGERLYASSSFYFNVKEGQGNSVVIGSSSTDTVTIEFGPGQTGLFYMAIDPLQKPHFCILRTSAPVTTAPPSTVAVVTSTASTASSTAATTESKVTSGATTANSIASGGDRTEDDDGVCFPALATVQLEGGHEKRMEELAVGDRVLSSVGVYSEVFSFTHKLRRAESYREFVRLSVGEERVLLLTASHYLYLNAELKSAGIARVGDAVMLGDGRTAAITSVGRENAYGLYNPQTVHGDIVVSGVVTSTYTQTVDASAAHAGLSVVRAAFCWFGAFTTAFESGSELAMMLPHGASTLA